MGAAKHPLHSWKITGRLGSYPPRIGERESQGVSSVDACLSPTCVSVFSSLLWLSGGRDLRTRPKASKAGQPLTAVHRF